MGALQTRHFLLKWLYIFRVGTGTTACVPRPVSIKLGDVSLPQNGQVSWGLNMAAGTPAQTLAFLPQWPLNDTFVYGADGYCPSIYTAASCISFRGGQCVIESSSTGTIPGPPVSASWSYPQLSFISDSLTLNENITLANYSLGIARNDWGAQGYHPQMALGMGANSSLINTLLRSGQIASRTWGLFFGARNPCARKMQVDGSLVLGGYDQGKIAGGGNKKAVVQLSEPSQVCASGMVVTINDIVLNFKNGSEASIFPQDRSSSLSACIVPDYPALFTIPRAGYFTKFENLTGATLLNRSYGLNYYSMRYMKDDHVYDGDMTIVFQGGFSVLVPNDHLVIPHSELDQHTGAVITDTNQPDLVINTLQDANANDMSTLGRHFLSVAYLMVNQDMGMFTLWPAQAGGQEDLVAVTQTGMHSQDLCPAASMPTTPPTEPSSTSQAVQSQTDSTASSTPGIISGVVGSMVGVVLVASGVIFLRKRRVKQTNTGIRTKIGNPEPIHEIGDYPRWPHPEEQELQG